MSGSIPDNGESWPRIAVVGAGYWGKNIARNFASLNALVGIVDEDRATAQAMGNEFNVGIMGFQDVLADATIAGVAIAVPAEDHYRIAKEALNAGKHVFVEKPLATSLREGEELVSLAERLDRQLMVGHLLQYHPAFLKLKSLVDGGELGRLYYLYSNRLNFGKIRREEDILWSFAPHDVSMILSLTGQMPRTVVATGGFHLDQKIADVTWTQLRFPKGCDAHIFVSWLHPFKEQKLVVIGSKAMAVFNDGVPWDSKLVLFPHRIDWSETGVPIPNPAASFPVAVVSEEPLKAETQHFLECIKFGSRPRTDGREGLRVLEVLTRASKSLLGSSQPAESKKVPQEPALER